MKVPEMPKMPDFHISQFKFPHILNLSKFSNLPLVNKFPLLKSTIFGFDLKIGVIAVSILGMIAGVLIMIGNYNGMHDEINSFEPYYGESYNSFSGDDLRRMFHRRLDGVMINTFFMFVGFLFACSCGMLIVGIKKNKLSFFLPWLITSLFGVIGVLCKAFYEGFNHRGIDQFVFRMLVFGGVWFYAFIVVHSYYKQKIEESIEKNNNLSHQVLSTESLTKDELIKPTDSCIA